MIVKRIYPLLLSAFITVCSVQAQTSSTLRAEHLKIQLDSLQATVPGLNRKVEFNVNNTEFPNFIRAIATSYKLNISIDPSLKGVIVNQNFSSVSVKDVLVFSCKKYDLDIKLFGSIISISKHVEGYKPRAIFMQYDKTKSLLSIDLQSDSLAVVFKKITDLTGKNLMFSPDLSSKKISGYIKEMPFESALDKLAFSNNLLITKTKDNYYLFEAGKALQSNTGIGKPQRTMRYKNANFYFKVLDTVNKIIDVDFENVAISNVVNEIGLDLKINMFTAFPLTEMGKTSFKARDITFDKVLEKIFEKDTIYSYKKEKGIYFFGKRKQASLRSTVSIPLIYRSIEIMDEPMDGQNNRNGSANSMIGGGTIYSNGQNINFTGNQNGNYLGNQNNGFPQKGFAQATTKTEALLDILPKEITSQLAIKSDVEHNSFIVSGPTQKIEKFRAFVKMIDKPVPVILIEVMLIEVSKSASVSTGISLGIGDSPTTTKGIIFPNGNITLGATTINKIIGGFNGFGALNIGKVTPNFYAKLEALETNGDVKIKSTPKLATLNGHQATLSNGQRSYYAVTTTDIIGTQNPQTREVKNYVPIDADLSIKIKPLVSGNGDITLSIKVVQSSFNGDKIDPTAPPGISSREFTSTIRVKDQDVVILGGLEENVKNDSGSGVPFLARVPIIKYLFSKRTRTASKMKLSVLIKPTIIK